MKIPVSCATVAQRLRNPLAALRGIVDLGTWQDEFGLTLSEAGQIIGEVHPNGHGGRPYHKTSFWHWRHGRELTPDALEAFAIATDRIIRERTSGRLIVRARFFKRRWQFTAYATCNCGRAFKPERLEDAHCPRCLKRKAHR